MSGAISPGRCGPDVGVARASTGLILFGLLAFAFLVRAQTFGNPVLGFDEQFYLLVGDRMLHGAIPYVDIFDRKPIGLFLIYDAIRELGVKVTCLHEGTVLAEGTIDQVSSNERVIEVYLGR